MSRKVSNFKLGLFVILGCALALAILIYFGASKYFDNANSYVTFFNHSVQGLQRDSVVKYLGVSVGRVRLIRVAPDYNLIEVVMDIDFEGDLTRTVTAQLRTIGITGIAFIELTRTKPGEPDLSPRIDFASEYPIIPSKPSEMTQIVSSIEKITKQLGDISFKGIADKLNQVLETTQQLVGDERLKRAIKSLEAAAKSAEALSERSRKIVAGLDLKGVETQGKKTLVATRKLMEQGRELVKETQALVAQGRALTEQAGQELHKMHLPRASRKAGRLMDALRTQTEELSGTLRKTSENLRRTSRAMETLLWRLERSPSDIIFSQPPSPRKVE